jgi:HD-GYP domain-containing protein (c-di-GMP phosphodiesterase class II)
VAHVLLIGADRDLATGLRSLLRQDRNSVTWIKTESGWREAEREASPEVIVAVVAEPEALLAAPGEDPRGFPAPILLVEPEDSLSRDLEVEERLVDAIARPFLAEEFLGRVDALVRVRRVLRRESLEDESAEPGIARKLAALLGARVPSYQKPLGPYLEVASRVAGWAERRDAFEPGHAERVTSFCALMAEGLGFSETESASLLRAAMLHDIGKVALPVEVLRREGPLAEEQMRLVRTHPGRGAALLRALDPDETVIETVLYHHERSDGRGYYGKAGDSIPMAARVLAVAEVFDAMTTSRVRKPMGWQEALGALRGPSDHGLDPACVDALVRALAPKPSTVPLRRLPS